MALLDEEETDWKVIVIDVNDPLASKLNDVEDVERHLPGLLRATNEWFRIYKIPDGKPENQFAFTGECKNKKYAMDVVHECAEAWERLITGKTPAGGVSTYVFGPMLLTLIPSLLTCPLQHQPDCQPLSQPCLPRPAASYPRQPGAPPREDRRLDRQVVLHQRSLRIDVWTQRTAYGTERFSEGWSEWLPGLCVGSWSYLNLKSRFFLKKKNTPPREIRVVRAS